MSTCAAVRKKSGKPAGIGSSSGKKPEDPQGAEQAENWFSDEGPDVPVIGHGAPERQNMEQG